MNPRYQPIPQWRYFLRLENDLGECFRFVHPCEDHYEVYSESFARIILLASTEIENCVKLYAKEIENIDSQNNLKDYKDFIKRRGLFNEEIKLMEYPMAFKPWHYWGKCPSKYLDWWKYGYCAIKHDRLNNPEAATLKRTIECVGALCVLLQNRHKNLGIGLPRNATTSLFAIDGGNFKRYV